MGALDDAPEGLRCVACAECYPFLGGRPVLMRASERRELGGILSTGEGTRMVREYGADGEGAPSRDPAWLRLLRPPSVMHRYFADLSGPPGSMLFEPRGGRTPLVLNVGGGPRRESDGEITLNIGPFPNVDLIADGQRIPVADGTFDAVFSLAVLEHVPDAPRVVAEMMRVLRPGGWLYSEVPFIFFFHGYPSDYARYTREGMKRLFAGLEEARFGMVYGPVSALLQSGNMVLQMLVPGRSRILRKAANGLYRWIFFPFKYLDLLLRDHADAHTVAGGFYVIGRKPGGARDR